MNISRIHLNNSWMFWQVCLEKRWYIDQLSKQGDISSVLRFGILLFWNQLNGEKKIGDTCKL